jgi:O-methyltransferase
LKKRGGFSKSTWWRINGTQKGEIKMTKGRFAWSSRDSGPEILLNLYLMLPLPISKYVYSAARNTFFPDSRLPYFRAIFEKISTEKIAGDYLEFGVFRGTSFIMSNKLSQEFNIKNMRFFAFDSFEGLPNSEGNVLTKGELSCSEKLFKKILRKAGINLNNVFTIKGFYSNSLNEETIKNYNIKKASIVHIDCDLYTSTRDVLNFIESIIFSGTIIIFDDWDIFKYEDIENMGERKAFREWKMRDFFDDFCDFGGGGRRAFIMREKP